MSKNEFTPPFSSEQAPDKSLEIRGGTADRLRDLSERTGFYASAELDELGQSIIREPERATEIMEIWVTEAQSAVNALPEVRKMEAQIGLVISQAEVLFRAGLTESGNDMIEQALDLAYQMGFDELAQELANL